MKKTPVPLDTARLASARESVLAGLTIREASDRFGLNYEAAKRRASREGWMTPARVRREVAQVRLQTSAAAAQAVAATLAERGQAYLGKLASVSEKFASRAESMTPEELLTRARSIETLDKVARRTFALNDDTSQTTTILGVMGIAALETPVMLDLGQQADASPIL
ncbi:MAG: hypothetical protein WCS31_00945 [Verrucomicrobiae bacterium]